ncbi:2'-5' RNA ligase family protein [Leifsonia shinshuensis]|uniref:2'-5' RNA ligase family protein n=1 Tax=Leifsonia shinshuensis TaxID=150026 RepID=UPI001F5096EC|nr:2'-5' RNA ligase family protein [Leifsonia shinshuensis]MCI0158914.1 2'-5' RNA ligase family protein [Leifsonia shinshuensis]
MRPFMTDRATLASLEGQQYVVLRPAAEVGAFYAEEQRILLDRLPTGLPHPNTGHITLRGFAEPDRVDALRAAVRACAAAQDPIEAVVEAIDGFPAPFQVLIARLRRSPALTEAYASMTRALESTDFERIGELPLDDWVFHLSLVYCAALSDDDWRAHLRASRRPVAPAPTELISSAEFVWYAGGVEHVEVVPLGQGASLH